MEMSNFFFDPEVLTGSDTAKKLEKIGRDKWNTKPYLKKEKMCRYLSD
jgi:hypothetical protein